MNTRSTIIASAVLAGLLSGCGGYRVGTLLPPNLQTVHVPLFRNETDEPRLEAVVTNAVITRLQEDGTLRVVAEDVADTALEARIIGYIRDPLRFQRDDPAATAEYRLRIVVAMTFRDNRTGEMIAQDPWVEGRTDFQVAGDLKTIERRNVPFAAEDLAVQVVKRVVEAW